MYKNKSLGNIWIQINSVLVFIFSRYWSKSIIRTPPSPLFASFLPFLPSFALDKWKYQPLMMNYQHQWWVTSTIHPFPLERASASQFTFIHCQYFILLYFHLRFVSSLLITLFLFIIFLHNIYHHLLFACFHSFPNDFPN